MYHNSQWLWLFQRYYHILYTSQNAQLLLFRHFCTNIMYNETIQIVQADELKLRTSASTNTTQHSKQHLAIKLPIVEYPTEINIQTILPDFKAICPTYTIMWNYLDRLNLNQNRNPQSSWFYTGTNTVLHDIT